MLLTRTGDVQTAVEPDAFTLAAPLAVQHLGRRLGAMPAGKARTLYLGRKVHNAPSMPLVRVVACALREAALGELEARLFIDTFGTVVTTGGLNERIEELVEAAQIACEHALIGMLQGEAVDFEIRDPNPRDAPKGSLAAQGETLGRRKMIARTAVGDTLDRILVDPHPQVIKNAMDNPRLNEMLVIRVAARRNCEPAILVAVSESKFNNRPRVRRALAINPGCPPAIACRLLTFLIRSDLLEIAHDAHLHDDVRAAARGLLEAKPPRLVHGH